MKKLLLSMLLVLTLAAGLCSCGKTRSESETTTSQVSESSEDTSSQKTPGYLIVLDPGHQKKGDVSQEPLGPYKKTPTKKKVTYGTSGVKTRLAESELNLIVALKLRDILETRGYRVIMTRTTQDVNISNIERATIANDNKADAFIRIHADGSSSASLKGMHTIAPLGTSGNTYQVGELRERSYKLSQCVLDGAIAATGATKRKIAEHDNFSGHNWSQVPVTMIEMGYMTNPEEDVLLSQDDYQNKIAEGIANGLDAFFKE